MARKIKRDRRVMFAVKAPPLGAGATVIKTDLRAFDAVNWVDPDDCEKSQSRKILELDKDIIRAIYYLDNVASINKPELFTAALAESVKRWSQRLSPVQQPYFNRSGLHWLEITEIDSGVEWFWTFNINNRMQLQTNKAWLSPL